MHHVKLVNAIVSLCLCLVILGILLLLPSSFGSIRDKPTIPTAASSIPETLPPESTPPVQSEVMIPDLTVTEAHTFACTAEDFIRCYNALYYSDKNALWLSAPAAWSLYPREAAPCTSIPGDRYTFDPDPAVHNEPAISLYLWGGRISQATVTLAEHDWTQWRYEMFLEQCQYTLRVFFPELTDIEIEALIVGLYEEASQSQHSAASCTVYCQGSAGCCAYEQNGIVHICVVPVAEGTSDPRYIPLE